MKFVLKSCDRNLTLDSFQSAQSRIRIRERYSLETHEWKRKFAESVDAERPHPRQHARANLRAAGCTLPRDETTTTLQIAIQRFDYPVPGLPDKRNYLPWTFRENAACNSRRLVFRTYVTKQVHISLA